MTKATRQPTLFPIEDDGPVPAAPPPAKPPRGLKLRGFTCPHCPGARLFVYKSRRPCAGRVVRYRKCPSCPFRTTTEERAGRVLPPVPARDTAGHAP